MAKGKRYKIQEANQIISNLEGKAEAKKLAAAQTAAGAEAEYLEVLQLKADHQSELNSEYSRGFEDGKASVVLPSPDDPEAKYTQAQLDEAVALAKQEVSADMQPKIDQAVADKDAALAHADAIKSTAEAALQDLKVKDDALVDEAIAAVKNS